MIPLWLKLGYTVIAAAIVVVYARKYKLQNFLWFSDIALITTVPALWLESSFLASMMAIGVLLPELYWNIGFFTRLLTGRRIGGLTDYMFERKVPLYLRALSLFHVFLPVLLLWMIRRLGYSPNALYAQSLLAILVLPLTYGLSDGSENINWVYGLREWPQKRLPPLVYLGVLMVAFPVLIYLPTHLLLKEFFG
jgi:hypothetical protein